MRNKNTKRRLLLKKKSHRGKSLAQNNQQQVYSISDAIYALLQKSADPLKYTNLQRKLKLSASFTENTDLFDQALEHLIKTGRIEQYKKCYALTGSQVKRPHGQQSKTLQGTGKNVRARLEVTSRGHCFAAVEGELAGKKNDVLIAETNTGGAIHGDKVLVELCKVSGKRRQGRVVQVLERATTTICGILSSPDQSSPTQHRRAKKYRHQDQGALTLLPDDTRLPYTVAIAPEKSKNAPLGHAVLAKIIEYGDAHTVPTGEVLEVLGDPEHVAVQIRMAMEQFHLPLHFPAHVEEEAALLTPFTASDKNEEEQEKRLDLRHLHHVTIDGKTAKDFDDAIYVEEHDQGFRLYVSIADVSHYVHPDSAIDREAYKRGTSVYFPDRVIPMLPERLSNDLCSLVPNQDRPAFTAILDFDQQGKRIAQQYSKSIITSHYRFTYNAVHNLIYTKKTTPDQQTRPFVPMLQRAAQLAKLLTNQRRKRGSLAFTLPEPEILMDDGVITTIHLAERNQAHALIEECMLAANEAVAATLDTSQQELLYRTHAYPDPSKVEKFTDAGKALGLHLPPTDISPHWFAAVLGEAAKGKEENRYVVNSLLLRTMQQARYTPENSGHFALAASHYLHFTSPIRRYPDLVAHRALQAFLTTHMRSGSSVSQAASKKNILPTGKNMDMAGQDLSQRERNAVDTERNIRVRLAALFMRERVGEHFDAVISGVASFGLFVELKEYTISGAIPLENLNKEYYLHDDRRHLLIGESSNTIYQLGQGIRVRLDHVDLFRKRLVFSPVAHK